MSGKRGLVGNAINVDGRRGKIKVELDFISVLVAWEDGEHAVIERSALRERPAETPAAAIYSADEHAEAERLQRVLAPVLEPNQRTNVKVLQLVAEAGLSRATIYRRLAAYDEDPVSTSLLPASHRQRDGRVQLNPAQDAIITKLIETEYLTRKRRTLVWVYRKLVEHCRAAGEPSPHYNTVYARIRKLDPFTVKARRYGKKSANETMKPIKGPYPFGTEPLGAVQMDFWTNDVEIVDEELREPIGRPYLTLAIDVATRMPYGLYLALDHPSANSAGLALCNGAFEKTRYLASVGGTMDWPVWGKPRMLHLDRDPAFRSGMMIKGCKRHKIELRFKPRRKPQWGAHIESLFGTFAHEFLALPGATGGRPGQRNKDNKPAMTLAELEYYFVNLLKVYVNRPHSALDGRSPLQAWKEWFFPEGAPARPLPREIVDEQGWRLDFMPKLSCTIQRGYGVRLNHIDYRNDEIMTFAHPAGEGRAPRYEVRRDPRDISKIWVFIPKLGRHVPVGYWRRDAPPMNLWAQRAVVARLRERGKKVDEAAIFSGYKEMTRIVETAIAATKASQRPKSKAGKGQRRAREQARHHQRDLARETAPSKKLGSAASPVPVPERSAWVGDILDDIDF